MILQGIEHAAAVARAVEEENKLAVSVFICGATGPYSAMIDGFYEATEERGLDGRVLYKKRGGDGVWIEHFVKEWQIKHASDKGRDSGNAYVAGCCGLKACVSLVWDECDGKEYKEQPSLKMTTGPEAERQVGGPRMRAREHGSAFLQPAWARVFATCDARVDDFAGH